MKNIFLNVTAAQYGGALTIIEQFLEAFRRQPVPGVRLYVFCTADLSGYASNDITLIRSSRKNFLKRLYWDYIGIKKWASSNNIHPSLIISFQNTGVFFGKIPQIIYLHNAIPFTKAAWSPFKKEERSLWFYRNIYPFFIEKTIFPHTYFVVQTQWMKQAVAEKFSFPDEKIAVALPDIEWRTVPEVPILEQEVFHFFYPASPTVFKNHIDIIRAAAFLRTLSPMNFSIHLTCMAEELPAACQRALKDKELANHFCFQKTLSHAQVMGYYCAADTLLFPSTIETVGLPLLEAASCGMPIIAADLPYTRSILKGYPDVYYATLHDPLFWAKTMLEAMQRKVIRKRWRPVSEDGWIKVLSLIENILNNVSRSSP